MNLTGKHFIRDLNLKGKTLDIGSYDVNGCVREYFDDYIGMDMREGPNVDLVGRADDIPFHDETFDNVISLEMLEHDNRFWISILEMVRVLKTGGTLALTARGIGFGKHDYPNDYYRFTEEAFIDLFEYAGCEVKLVMPDPYESGVFGYGIKL